MNDELWHEGVIGIVASKIAEKYHKPTILFSKGKLFSKGSGRSIKGFNLFNALKSCDRFIDVYGGHSMAAGLKVKNENIVNLERCLNDLAAGLKEQSKEKEILIDKLIPLEIIDDNLYHSISLLAPFGPENPRPVFASFNVSLKYEPRIVGNRHVKLKFRKSGNSLIDGIFFNGKDYMRDITSKRIDICYTIRENSYMGKNSIELQIMDMRNAAPER